MKKNLKQKITNTTVCYYFSPILQPQNLKWDNKTYKILVHFSLSHSLNALMKKYLMKSQKNGLGVTISWYSSLNSSPTARRTVLSNHTRSSTVTHLVKVTTGSATMSSEKRQKKTTTKNWKLNKSGVWVSKMLTVTSRKLMNKCFCRIHSYPYILQL